jgi:hypothetical protein
MASAPRLGPTRYACPKRSTLRFARSLPRSAQPLRIVDRAIHDLLKRLGRLPPVDEH